MCLRWTAADMLEAERQLRKISGYRDLAKLALVLVLVVVVEGELHRNPTQESSLRESIN